MFVYHVHPSTPNHQQQAATKDVWRLFVNRDISHVKYRT